MRRLLAGIMVLCLCGCATSNVTPSNPKANMASAPVKTLTVEQQAQKQELLKQLRNTPDPAARVELIKKIRAITPK